MTRLGIMLRQPYARGFVEAAALLAVRLLADPDGKVTKLSWSEEKPAPVIGDDPNESYTVFDLPNAGYYSVEVTPPRGPHISMQYLVSEDEFHKEIVEMEGSPHEYLGWQQYAGILRNNSPKEETPRTNLERLHFRSGSRGIVSDSISRPSKAFRDEPSAVPTVWALYPFSAPFFQPWTQDWWDEVKRAPLDPRRMLNWPLQDDQEFATWFPVMPTAYEGQLLVESLRHRDPFLPPISEQFPRWIFFQVGTQVDLASVPWAWFGAGPDRGPADEIRFLYDRIRTGSVDRKSSGYLNLSVQDQRWFGLLQFLSSDRMNRAGELVNELFRDYTAESALAGKVKGPLAAVAGAIVLVTQAQTTETQPWDQWLRSLTEWFPAIPDGPVLLGSRLLQKAQTREQLREAYGHLVEGCRRGIPYFSATIRILDMALAQSSDDILETESWRRRIAFVSSRVDPTQPFTVIRIGMS